MKAIPYRAPRPNRYHVTAINPLTRQRESVTPPCSKEKAVKILAKVKRVSPRKRTWKYPKVEIYPPRQLHLNFNNL